MPKKCLFLIVIGGLVLFYAFGAYGQTVHKITFESVYAQGHPNTVMCEKALNAMMKASNGRLKFEFHYLEPIPAKELMDAAGTGIIDSFHSTANYYSGQVGIADFTSAAANFASFESAYDTYQKTDVLKIMDGVYRKKANLTIIYPFILSSPQRFHISKRMPKVTKLEDFKDKKMRVTGPAVFEVVKALGAVPVSMIVGEIYTSLQRGTVDCSMLPDYALSQYKTWEVCHQVVGPYIMPAVVNPLWMNVDAYNKLPKDLQDVMRSVAQDHELFKELVSDVQKNDSSVIKKAVEEHGVELFTLPADDTKRMIEAGALAWDFYVKNCEKQGLGEEAKTIRNIVYERFKKEYK